MKRQLFIVRHAQPHLHQDYQPDKARMLKPEGIIQARQLGKFLNDSSFTINLILSSDAERAKTTACLIAEVIDYPAHLISIQEKLYSESLHDVFTAFEKIPETIENVLLVGHYPTVVDLYNFITRAQKTGMSTAELNVVNIECNWSALTQGCGAHLLNFQPNT